MIVTLAEQIRPLWEAGTRSKTCSFCLARVTPLTRGIAGNKSAICADCVERIHVANNPDGLGERGA